jgi:hypothetical protein
VRSVLQHELRCVGVALNGVPVTDDIAVRTNTGILRKILNVPLLGGLGENLMELPADWQLMIDSSMEV